MNRRAFVLSLSGLVAAARGALASVTPDALRSAQDRLEALARAKGRRFPFVKPSIRIRKKDRVLELSDGGVVVKTCTVALGHDPVGPKRVEGDMRTPEGRYFVCYRNADSQFHLFLGLSYPNAADAEAARKAGVIDAATAKRLAVAEAAREKPDWYTKMGGAVGIHGGGTGQDWTWGCIALDDADVDELWLACPEGTPVEVVP